MGACGRGRGDSSTEERVFREENRDSKGWRGFRGTWGEGVGVRSRRRGVRGVWGGCESVVVRREGLRVFQKGERDRGMGGGSRRGRGVRGKGTRVKVGGQVGQRGKGVGGVRTLTPNFHHDQIYNVAFAPTTLHCNHLHCTLPPCNTLTP